MRIANILRTLTVLGALAARLSQPAAAQTLDKVSFGTNWVAQAEHGGFFQAVADGTYKKYGLDVTIIPGGPNVNNRILMISAKIDFFMSANSLQTFDAVSQQHPDRRDRLDVPEGSAGPAGASGSQREEAGRPEAADAVRLQGRRRRATSSG